MSAPLGLEERAPAPPASWPPSIASLIGNRLITLAVAVVGAAATAGLVLTDVRTPLRSVVVLAFLVIGPGLGYAGLLRDTDPPARLAVSFACSLTILALVGETMILLDAWSPRTGLVAVLLLFGLGVALERWWVRPWCPSGVPSSQVALAMDQARIRRHRRPVIADHVPLLVSAVVLWVMAMATINLGRVGDYGLISVLPISFYVGLLTLVASFSVAVARRGTPTTLLALHVVVLIVMIHGTLALVYEAPRYAWVYKHVGVVEFIIRHGQVDQSIDIYHNWPGFFALSALATQLAGAASPLPLVAWAQLGFSLLDLAALVFVYRSLTLDRRLVWLGAWIFFAVNWVGQEYFSPQALTFFLSLVVLGVCLQWLPADLVGREQRTVATGIVLALFMVIASSHQLTPWVLVAGVTALVVLGRCRPWALPVAMVLLAAGWVWLAYPYLAQLDLFGNFGHPGGNGQVVDLTNQSEGRVFVATVSRALTAAVWLLALVGVIRHWRSGLLRSGYWALLAVALALVPFSTVVAQSYGGEILFRAYLFSLPWMAFLAAAAFFPNRSAARSLARARRTAAALTMVSSLLAGGLLVAYFGLERANHLRAGEVAAAHRFYQVAPPGSFLLLVAPNFPTRLDANYPDYRGYSYDPSLLAMPGFQDRMLGPADVDAVARELAGYRHAYLMVSTSQAAYAELFDITPPGAVERLQQGLLDSPRFRVVYRNGDATLFRFRR
jgi:hypothetical protein